MGEKAIKRTLLKLVLHNFETLSVSKLCCFKLRLLFLWLFLLYTFFSSVCNAMYSYIVAV